MVLPFMTFDWKMKTILVAEDEPANFLFIEKIIAPTQAKIIRAKNGSEAINYVENNTNIDVILMDIYMPEIDGFEAAKIIKKINPNLPIIAQTFYNDEIDKEKVQKSSFDNFISKPININKLLIVLDKYLK